MPRWSPRPASQRKLISVQPLRQLRPTRAPLTVMAVPMPRRRSVKSCSRRQRNLTLRKLPRRRRTRPASTCSWAVAPPAARPSSWRTPAQTSCASWAVTRATWRRRCPARSARWATSLRKLAQLWRRPPAMWCRQSGPLTRAPAQALPPRGGLPRALIEASPNRTSRATTGRRGRRSRGQRARRLCGTRRRSRTCGGWRAR
mmetsp:Transcript_42140/g.109254  ORF Transcript_42140/g.109254 Transcript_42140/m.109254 type:complete len:201 (-) Transcript_42140:420-1022(-)